MPSAISQAPVSPFINLAPPPHTCQRTLDSENLCNQHLISHFITHQSVQLSGLPDVCPVKCYITPYQRGSSSVQALFTTPYFISGVISLVFRASAPRSGGLRWGSTTDLNLPTFGQPGCPGQGPQASYCLVSHLHLFVSE